MAVSAFYFTACQKDALDYSTFTTTPDVIVSSPVDRVLKGRFFQTPTNLHPEFQLLIENLKKQDSLKNFITQAWVQKNGLPVWDKTFSNLEEGSQTSFGSAGRDFNLYFTPLKSEQSDKIQSYIVSYQNDSSQYHRLYNYDELAALKISKKDIREEATGALSVFSYFEKVINNKNSMTIGEPFNVSFENSVMLFGGKSNSQLHSRSACYEISVSWGLQAAMGWGYSSAPICWDVSTSYQELTWSTGVSNGPSASGWPSSGTGNSGGTNSFVNWSGTSYASLNISDLMSALAGEIPKQQLLNLFPNDAAFINFVFSLKNKGETITQDYAERLYASYTKYTQAGFSESEIAVICKDIAFLQQLNTFLDTNSSITGFNQTIQKVMNPVNSSLSTAEKIQRLKTFVNLNNTFKTELTQLAQENATSISSSGDMNILMRIFGKVLGKKIGKVIPFVGTGLGAEAAWSAYRLGNYGEAAFELAVIAMDFIPAGILLETGWTIVDVAYHAFKAYKPIIALSEFLATNRQLLDAVIETLDDLNLFSNIEMLPQLTLNSAKQFAITLGNISTDDFLNKLATHLGTTWQVKTWGKYLELSPTFKLAFYPVPTTPGAGPTIEIQLGSVSFKIRLQ